MCRRERGFSVMEARRPCLAAFNAIVNAAVQEIRARQVSLDERIHCIKCSSLAA